MQRGTRALLALVTAALGGCSKVTLEPDQHDGQVTPRDGGLHADASDLSTPASKVCSVDNWCWENPLPQGTPVPPWMIVNGVWGSAKDDVFAVGDGGTIVHFDGKLWTSMASGITSTLSGVWGSARSDVFAVGNGGTILHYDGKSWSAMTSGTTSSLSGV